MSWLLNQHTAVACGVVAVWCLGNKVVVKQTGLLVGMQVIRSFFLCWQWRLVDSLIVLLCNAVVLLALSFMM